MLANSWESPFSDRWFYKSRTGDRKHAGDFPKKVQWLPAPTCWLLGSLCHSPGYKDLPASFPCPVPAKQACLILLPVKRIWNSFRSLRSTLQMSRAKGAADTAPSTSLWALCFYGTGGSVWRLLACGSRGILHRDEGRGRPYNVSLSVLPCLGLKKM